MAPWYRSIASHVQAHDGIFRDLNDPFVNAGAATQRRVGGNGSLVFYLFFFVYKKNGGNGCLWITGQVRIYQPCQMLTHVLPCALAMSADDRKTEQLLAALKTACLFAHRPHHLHMLSSQQLYTACRSWMPPAASLKGDRQLESESRHCNQHLAPAGVVCGTAQGGKITGATGAAGCRMWKQGRFLLPHRLSRSPGPPRTGQKTAPDSLRPQSRRCLSCRIPSSVHHLFQSIEGLCGVCRRP